MKNESREAVERQESLEETCAVTDLMLPGQGLGIGRAQRLAFECRRLEALAVGLARALESVKLKMEMAATVLESQVRSMEKEAGEIKVWRVGAKDLRDESEKLAALLSKAAKPQEAI